VADIYGKECDRACRERKTFWRCDKGGSFLHGQLEVPDCYWCKEHPLVRVSQISGGNSSVPGHEIANVRIDCGSEFD
jgi:hypothetical protein